MEPALDHILRTDVVMGRHDEMRQQWLRAGQRRPTLHPSQFGLYPDTFD
ncbi:hypothetical protein [Neoroseomonas lacus]